METQSARPVPTLKGRIGRALRSPTAKRLYVGAAVLVIVVLWANMVRRALSPVGSRFDDFIELSRDLVYNRVNIYEDYDFAQTSVGKYPPFFGLLFAPLVPLPTAIAASFWFLLNLALAAGATYLGVRTVAEPSTDTAERPSLFLIPLLLAAGLIGSNLETAQVNILIMFLVFTSLFTFRRGADITAGLVLGLVTALKLTPALFIAYFAYKLRLRVILGAIIALVICWVVVPFVVFGQEHFVAVMRGWYGILFAYVDQGLLAEGVSGFRHTNQSLSAVLHRFFTETPVGAGRDDLYLNVASLSYDAAAMIVRILSVVILLSLAWLCRTPTADRSHIGLSFEYALVMIAALFISPVTWINHYVILLFPYALGVYYLATRSGPSRARTVMLYSMIISFVLVSSSVSRLMQAVSLPFLGALILFFGLAFVGRGEAHGPR